jgi:MoxR-like ATPase
MEFRRIQFTPDLMPPDVTGSSIFDQRAATSSSAGPDLHEPPARRRDQPRPPKTQAALLEAMQERQVTSRASRAAAEPFLVLATQNPIEYEGTYPLPEAQLDRFLLRLASATRPARTSGASSQRRLERARTRSSSSPSSTHRR